jgi:hypothetical protein
MTALARTRCSRQSSMVPAMEAKRTLVRECPHHLEHRFPGRRRRVDSLLVQVEVESSLTRLTRHSELSFPCSMPLLSATTSRCRPRVRGLECRLRLSVESSTGLQEPAPFHQQYDPEGGQRADEKSGGERQQSSVIGLADHGADPDAKQGRD